MDKLRDIFPCEFPCSTATWLRLVLDTPDGSRTADNKPILIWGVGWSLWIYSCTALSSRSIRPGEKPVIHGEGRRRFDHSTVVPLHKTRCSSVSVPWAMGNCSLNCRYLSRTPRVWTYYGTIPKENTYPQYGLLERFHCQGLILITVLPSYKYKGFSHQLAWTPRPLCLQFTHTRSLLGSRISCVEVPVWSWDSMLHLFTAVNTQGATDFLLFLDQLLCTTVGRCNRSATHATHLRPHLDASSSREHHANLPVASCWTRLAGPSIAG